jgi:hypothetical protein
VAFATERRKHPPHFQSPIAVEVDELPHRPTLINGRRPCPIVRHRFAIIKAVGIIQRTDEHPGRAAPR